MEEAFQVLLPGLQLGPLRGEMFLRVSPPGLTSLNTASQESSDGAYLLVPVPDLPEVVDVQLGLHVLLPVEGDEGHLAKQHTHNLLELTGDECICWGGPVCSTPTADWRTSWRHHRKGELSFYQLNGLTSFCLFHVSIQNSFFDGFLAEHVHSIDNSLTFKFKTFSVS